MQRIFITLLSTLPFLGVEMSPLGGSWIASLVIWGVWGVLVAFAYRKALLRLRLQFPVRLRDGDTVTTTRDETTSDSQSPRPCLLEHVTPEQSELASWASRLRDEDRGGAGVTGRLHVITKAVDFHNVFGKRPTIKFHFEFVSSAIHTIEIKKRLDGRVKFQSQSLASPPELTVPGLEFPLTVRRSDSFRLSIVQPLTEQEVQALYWEAVNNRGCEFDLRGLVIPLMMSTPGNAEAPECDFKLPPVITGQIERRQYQISIDPDWGPKEVAWDESGNLLIHLRAGLETHYPRKIKSVWLHVSDKTSVMSPAPIMFDMTSDSQLFDFRFKLSPDELRMAQSIDERTNRPQYCGWLRAITPGTHRWDSAKFVIPVPATQSDPDTEHVPPEQSQSEHL